MSCFPINILCKTLTLILQFTWCCKHPLVGCCCCFHVAAAVLHFRICDVIASSVSFLFLQLPRFISQTSRGYIAIKCVYHLRDQIPFLIDTDRPGTPPSRFRKWYLLLYALRRGSSFIRLVWHDEFLNINVFLKFLQPVASWTSNLL